jgi:hypothetical protein
VAFLSDLSAEKSGGAHSCRALFQNEACYQNQIMLAGALTLPSSRDPGHARAQEKASHPLELFPNPGIRSYSAIASASLHPLSAALPNLSAPMLHSKGRGSAPASFDPTDTTQDLKDPGPWSKAG